MENNDKNLAELEKNTKYSTREKKFIWISEILELYMYSLIIYIILYNTI